MKQQFFLILILILSASLAKAQTTANDTISCTMNKCFCGSDLTPAGIMIGHVHEKNEWMISYRHMSMQMAGNQMGREQINSNTIFNNYVASPEKMQMKMQMLMMMYGVTERLTLMTMFHYNSNYMEMQMKMGDVIHPHSMKTSGVGDTKITALFALVKKVESQFILNAGLNLPTGACNLKGSKLDMIYPSGRLPYNMQLGSGSGELLSGATYILKKEKFTFSSQFSSVVRLKTNLIGYRHGNEYGINVWSAFSWMPFISSSLRLEGALNQKIKQSDPSLNINNEPGSNPNNYGGKYVNTYFGTIVQLKKGAFNKFRIGIEYGLPLYQNVNGIQMSNKQSFTINASFNL